VDWKVVGGTFVAVFVAELGDKTQLATLVLAAGQTARLSVFLGAAAALVATSALSVLGAQAIAAWVPPAVLRRVAAALFVVLGVGLWFGVFDSAER
jgi:Ca2+/H+ antiporter, TMEM165/GDT1 family